MTDITQTEFDLVDDSAQFFAPASTDMIDGLLAQYRAMRKQVAEIAAFMVPRLDGGAIDYYLEGNRSDERGRLAMSLSAQQLFDEPGAVAALNCAVLEAKGHRVAQADFINFAESTGSRFDRVVMNPPFSEGRAEAHTLAAAGLLRPGGRLVAILPSGMRGKDLPGLACTWSRPMSNQFPGVSVDVVLLTADKPA